MLVASLALPALPLLGQQPAAVVPPPQDGADATVEVVAGPGYEAGGLKRFFFGDGYRDLWTTPIQVQVLDMERTAGGLEAAFRVGGAQTKGLAIAGADGRSYTFRAVDKDPSSILPPELRNTPFEKIVQDQISSSFPGAPLVANPLARAAGVPQVEARLVVLPDDERLGEFREDFAGLFGTFEEYPTAGDDGEPGTFGALEFIDGRDMFARITAGWDTRVDVDAYLRARLLDLVLGDWDRHVEQWRYARFADREEWVPIPEDRDQAFSRYDGVVMAGARDREPKFDVFGPDYTSLEGLTWNARTVDRRLLAGIERERYVQIARELQVALGDAEIAAAVANLPDPYEERAGERLQTALQQRRDRLVQEAEALYEYWAHEVDVRTTNEPDLVRIEPAGDRLRVTVLPLRDALPGDCDAPADAGEPLFARTFLSSETREVRLYVGGGDDRVLLQAGSEAASGAIAVRLIGGADRNVVCDLGSGRSWAFGLANAAEPGRGFELLDNVRVVPGETIEQGGTPAEEQGPAATAQRDWGSTVYRVPWVGVAPDVGVFLGLGVAWEQFGFRQRPYAARHQLRAGFAIGAARPRVDYEGKFHLENRRTHYRVRALASGIETINFFGFGNDTVGEEGDFFRVTQSQLAFESRAVLPLGADGWLSIGPVVRFVATNTDDERRFVDISRPYGVEDTGQLGWVAGVSVNTRDFPGTREVKPTDDIRRMGLPSIGPGIALDVDATYYPEVWGLDHDYLVVQGAASGWLHFGQFAPALGIRVGGQKNYGNAPYYDSAFLGGRELRGLPVSRFAGDSSFHVNVGLLLSLTEATIVVPGRVGLMTHGGAGRVWLDGEDSDTWHWSYGGGVWWAPWTMSNSLRLGVAQSDEGFEVYLVNGFGF